MRTQPGLWFHSLPAPPAVQHRHVDAAVLVAGAEIERGGLVVEVGVEEDAAVLAVGHGDRLGAVLLQCVADGGLVLDEAAEVAVGGCALVR